MANRGRATTPGRALIAILSVSWALAGTGASAAVTAVPEGRTVEQLTGAVVMTLARFVEWAPQDFASATAPIIVGVVADEAVTAALEALARGKNVAGRTLAVRRLQWDSNITGVHMLFVGDTQRRHLEAILERIRFRPIVTASRLSEFGRLGGMITLTFTDGRVTFAVNSRATSLGGVRLSSFLLSHATTVSDESSGSTQ